MSFEEWLTRMLPWATQLLLLGVVGWAWWSMKKQFRTCQECDAKHAGQDRDCANKHGSVSRRVANLEQVAAHIEHMPTSKEMGALAREVTELRGGQSQMQESIKALGISIDRIERPINLLLEHHLAEGKK